LGEGGLPNCLCGLCWYGCCWRVTQILRRLGDTRSGEMMCIFRGCVGFFVVLIMYSCMDFYFVSASRCSLLCASFATSKCPTHSLFCFKGINWRDERSMLSAKCVSWCASMRWWFLQYHLILSTSLLSLTCVKKLTVWWSSLILFFQRGSKNSIHVSHCSLFIVCVGFLHE
jgi:hypothetical protein